jgi:CcmD family protein
MTPLTVSRAMRAGVAALVVVASLAAAAPALAQPGPPATPGQSEFVPVKDLPQAEQLPAGRLVIAAYAFVWVALLVYVWSLWRRVGKVQQDLEALDRRIAEGNRRV